MKKEDFILQKLQRALWISKLSKNEIYEGIKLFETYINQLDKIKNDKNFKNEIIKEISTSKDLFADKINSVGNVYFTEKDYASALFCYTKAFCYQTKKFKNIKNYVVCLEKLKLFDIENDLLNFAETFSDNKAEIYVQLAKSYDELNQNFNSIKYYNKYLEIKKEKNEKITAEDYNFLGCFYNKLYTDNTHKKEDIKTSLENFKKASDMEPSIRLFAKNATIMAGKGNFYDDGKKYWDRMLQINRMTNDDKFDYACFCMKYGDFETCFKYFDSRFNKENNKTKFPTINKPLWKGEDIKDATLLVHFEQGFGDTFLMFGYFKRLVKLAKHIIFVVQNAVYPLLKDNNLGIEIISDQDVNLDTLDFDYYIPSMSIPSVLKLNKDNISAGEGYINVNDEKIKNFYEKYINKNDKFKIGISFCGSKTGNQTRDIPIKELLPLDKLPDIEIYSLTKGVEDSAFDRFTNKVKNLGNLFNDFADTAAAISNMDLIITSDNSILNLAGALGKRTFGIFNHTYDFRWFDLSGDNVVWLTSVKPFVCEDIDFWGSAVSKVVCETEKIIKNKN